MQEKQTDIQPILEQGLTVRLKDPVIVNEGASTYPIKDDIWANWLPFAYKAFRLISQENIRSFAAIGSGLGADAIGAIYAFKGLQKIVVTDLDDKLVQTIEENVKRHAGSIEVISGVGSLCNPLRKKGITVDLMYENLPNIPDSGNIIEGYRRASRFKLDAFKAVNEHAKKYLLESHFAFLLEARESLNPGGSVICSIGGRVPYNIIFSIFEQAGYRAEEVVAGFKIQTEPDEVLPGYANAEHGVEFDFYKYDEVAKRIDLKYLRTLQKIKGNDLKRYLLPERITAKQSLRLYEKDPCYKIGHTIHMIRAWSIQ